MHRFIGGANFAAHVSTVRLKFREQVQKPYKVVVALFLSEAGASTHTQATACTVSIGPVLGRKKLIICIGAA